MDSLTQKHILTGLSRVPKGPLYGTLVVAFDQQIAGSLASEELARAGATVIKVERPDGDPKRHNSPPTAFNTFNAGKLSVVFGKTDKEKALKLDLLRHADVIIDNRSQAAQGRDEELNTALNEKRNKPLIFCGISGFGPNEPAPAYDRVVQAKTGMADLNNGLITFPIIDMATGMEAAKSIGFQLAMINGMSPQDKEKLGCVKLHVSMAASAMALMANQIAVFSETREKQSTLVPFDLFQTKNGRISLAIATDAQYASLCDVLDLPSIKKHKTSAERLANRQEIEDELRKVLPTKTLEEWLHLLKEKNIPAEPVHSFQEGVENYAGEMMQPDLDGKMYIGGATSSSLFPRNASIGTAPELDSDHQSLIQLMGGLRVRTLPQLLALADNKRGNSLERYEFVDLAQINFNQIANTLPWANGRVFEVTKKGRVRIEPIAAGEVFITFNDEGIQYKNVAKDGDVKAIAETGDKYLISRASLDKAYNEPDSEGWRSPKPIKLKAIVATQDIKYNAPWGKTAYAPAGSVIVQRSPQKIYAISPKNFERGYEVVNWQDAELAREAMRSIPRKISK